MKALTQKQANYARYLFLGLNNHDAYLKAGYSSKQKEATINHNACVLATDNNVVARLHELQKKAEDDSIMSVKERKQILTFLARMKGYKGVQAISELNRMDGAYAPVKQEDKIDFNLNFRVEDLSDAQLTGFLNRITAERTKQPAISKGTSTALLSVHNADLRDGETSNTGIGETGAA